MADAAISIHAGARLSLRSAGRGSLLELTAPRSEVDILRRVARLGIDIENAELANALLFPTGANISALLAGANPYNPVYGTEQQRITAQSHSSLAAHDTILKYIHTGDIRAVNDLDQKQIEDSLLVLGGSINNKVTQIILGTGRRSRFFELLKSGRYREGPPVRPLIDDQLHGAPPPNEWKVLIGHGKDQIAVSPGEYLLLTALPNPYNLEGRLFNVVGQSGLGVEAIKLVLANISLVEKLYRATRKMNAWQAFLPISDIRALAPRFEDFSIYEIKEDFDFKEPDIYNARYSSYGELLTSLAQDAIVIKPPPEAAGIGRGWRRIVDENKVGIGDADLARAISGLILKNGYQAVANEIAKQRPVRDDWDRAIAEIAPALIEEERLGGKNLGAGDSHYQAASS